MLKEFTHRVEVTYASGASSVGVDSAPEAIAEVLRLARDHGVTDIAGIRIRTGGDGMSRVTGARADTILIEERELWTDASGTMTRVEAPPDDAGTIDAKAKYENARRWANSEKIEYVVRIPMVNPDGEFAGGAAYLHSCNSEAEALAFAEETAAAGTLRVGESWSTNRRGKQIGERIPTMATVRALNLEIRHTLSLADVSVDPPHRRLIDRVLRHSPKSLS